MLSVVTYILSVGIIIAIPITGTLLLIDRIYFRKMRSKEDKIPFWVDWSAFLFPVVLFVGVLRSFIIQPFVIPTGSMQPTLYAGDMIIANNWSFGFRYPLLNTRIFSQPGDGVNRGDIAIFKYPMDPKINYIKRVIGLPGDTIDYKNKQLTINGVPLKYENIGNAKEPPSDLFLKEFMIDKNGQERSHLIQNAPFITHADRGVNNGNFTNFLRFPITVPKDSYLMMGDNRDNSLDGRFWGFVKDDQLLGKANFIWMNYKCITSFTDCDHIFTILR